MKHLTSTFTTQIPSWEPASILNEKSIIDNVFHYLLSSFRLYNIYYCLCIKLSRHMWDRILAVELFITHCTFGVGLNVTETSINRLFMVVYLFYCLISLLNDLILVFYKSDLYQRCYIHQNV